MNLTKGVHIAVFNLVIVATIGCFLRYFFLHPISDVNYSYVLHAHTHLAFLGWVFMALYVLIIHAYLPYEILNGGKFILMFFVLQVANMGMLFTFPFMGYALWSIVFSALHAVAAMSFAWVLIRKVPLQPLVAQSGSFIWIKWALILMVVSNLAPFALGPVSVTQGKGDLYHLLIYFYLHFQYNGWFTFALIGLMLWLLETRRVQTNIRLVRVGFRLKLIAVFPAYVLSTLWTVHDPVWNVLGGVSAVIQLAGLLCIGYFLIKNKGALDLYESFIHQILFWLGVFAVAFQHLLMLMSAVPYLSDLAFARNIVVAYLHMVFLGFVSIWLFLLFLKNNMIQLTLSSKLGFLLFLAAFVFTELVLVFQYFVFYSDLILFYLALMQLFGIICIAFNVKNIKLTV